MKKTLLAVLLIVWAASASAQNVGVGYPVNTVTPMTVQAASYSSGNAIGGLQTVAVFHTPQFWSGQLTSLWAMSKGGATAALTVYVFTALPTSTCTDKAAFVLAAADLPHLAMPPVTMTPAVIGVGSTVTFASAAPAGVYVKNSDAAPGTANIYVCFVTAGYTPGTVSDLLWGISMTAN